MKTNNRINDVDIDGNKLETEVSAQLQKQVKTILIYTAVLTCLYISSSDRADGLSSISLI